MAAVDQRIKDVVEALQQLGYDKQHVDNKVAGINAAELMHDFEYAPINVAVELYLATYARNTLLNRVIRSVLDKSSRIDEIKQTIPEMFI